MKAPQWTLRRRSLRKVAVTKITDADCFESLCGCRLKKPPPPPALDDWASEGMSPVRRCFAAQRPSCAARPRRRNLHSRAVQPHQVSACLLDVCSIASSQVPRLVVGCFQPPSSCMLLHAYQLARATMASGTGKNATEDLWRDKYRILRGASSSLIH